MIVNKDNNSVDIEDRDWDAIMPAYVAGYMFHSRNVPPQSIVFPMFRVVKFRGLEIPVQWVEPESAIAISIKEDGKVVPPSGEVAEPSVAESIPTAKGASVDMKPVFADRAPRMPAGPIIPPGQGSVDMTPRSASDLAKTKADLADQPEIDESKQKPIELTTDFTGKKIIKE